MSIPKSSKKEGVRADPANSKKPKTEELKTEPPISEKDEVKKAEDKTNRVTKK